MRQSEKIVIRRDFSCVDGRPISINFHADKCLSGEISLV